MRGTHSRHREDLSFSEPPGIRRSGRLDNGRHEIDEVSGRILNRMRCPRAVRAAESAARYMRDIRTTAGLESRGRFRENPTRNPSARRCRRNRSCCSFECCFPVAAGGIPRVPKRSRADERSVELLEPIPRRIVGSKMPLTRHESPISRRQQHLRDRRRILRKPAAVARMSKVCHHMPDADPMRILSRENARARLRPTAPEIRVDP
jgi:hypothetical protein